MRQEVKAASWTHASRILTSHPTTKQPFITETVHHLFLMTTSIHYWWSVTSPLITKNSCFLLCLSCLHYHFTTITSWWQLRVYSLALWVLLIVIKSCGQIQWSLESLLEESCTQLVTNWKWPGAHLRRNSPQFPHLGSRAATPCLLYCQAKCGVCVK